MYIHKLLPVVDGDFLFSNLLLNNLFSNFFITSILYLILSILTLLMHQALLAGLLRIIGNIDSCSIVLNLTQSFSISTKMRECLGNIIVKDIKGTLLLRSRLIKL